MTQSLIVTFFSSRRDRQHHYMLKNHFGIKNKERSVTKSVIKKLFKIISKNQYSKLVENTTDKRYITSDR